ncbi:MAG: hypothetical protein R3F60_18570 [bacterium]
MADPVGRRAWDTSGDVLLQAEIAALQALEMAIRAGDVLACIIEPYQCEGAIRPPRAGSSTACAASPAPTRCR